MCIWVYVFFCGLEGKTFGACLSSLLPSLLPFMWFVFWLYSLLSRASNSCLLTFAVFFSSKLPPFSLYPFSIWAVSLLFSSSLYPHPPLYLLKLLSVSPLSSSHQLCVEASFSPMRESSMNRKAYWEQWKSQSLPFVSLNTSLTPLVSSPLS